AAVEERHRPATSEVVEQRERVREREAELAPTTPLVHRVPEDDLGGGRLTCRALREPVEDRVRLDVARDEAPRLRRIDSVGDGRECIDVAKAKAERLVGLCTRAQGVG